MSGSTVPAAIVALTSIFRAAVPNTLQVSDGPEYDPTNDYLAVGWHSNAEPVSIVNYSIADAGRSRDQEDYDIACLLSYHVDRATTADTRAALYVTYELLAAALAANPTLAGSVSRARMSDQSYLPSISETGVTVSIRFSVNVIAWK